ncbi:MAG: hypothetical protein ABWZ66_03155 [Pyrinomonadaceae bacterium]
MKKQTLFSSILTKGYSARLLERLKNEKTVGQKKSVDNCGMKNPTMEKGCGWLRNAQTGDGEKACCRAFGESAFKARC